MADEIDVTGLLRTLQRENAKKKLSRGDITQSIRLELRAFGMNRPFKFTCLTPWDRSISLGRCPHPDDNQYDIVGDIYGFQKFPSLSLKQSCVEKDVKILRDEMRKLHSILKKSWENITEDDDNTLSLSEEETD